MLRIRCGQQKHQKQNHLRDLVGGVSTNSRQVKIEVVAGWNKIMRLTSWNKWIIKARESCGGTGACSKYPENSGKYGA